MILLDYFKNQIDSIPPRDYPDYKIQQVERIPELKIMLSVLIMKNRIALKKYPFYSSPLYAILNFY